MPSHYGLSGYGQMGSYSFSNNAFRPGGNSLTGFANPSPVGGGFNPLQMNPDRFKQPLFSPQEQREIARQQSLAKIQQDIEFNSPENVRARAQERKEELEDYRASRNNPGGMPKLNNFGDFVKAALALKYGR